MCIFDFLEEENVSIMLVWWYRIVLSPGDCLRKCTMENLRKIRKIPNYLL
jgi:hypothetical protein